MLIKTPLYIYTYLDVCSNAFMYVRKNVCVGVHVRACESVYAAVCVCKFIHVNKNVYVYVILYI